MDCRHKSEFNGLFKSAKEKWGVAIKKNAHYVIPRKWRTENENDRKMFLFKE
jgi:hypothetical protein